MISDLTALLGNELFFEVLKFLGRYLYVWMPIFFGYIFWRMWVRYIRALYISEQETMVLEIKIPKEISKSPAAMELALGAFHQSFGEGNLFEIYWSGSVRPWFSLEIASFGGEIHFYIWTPKRYKDAIEAYIYAQYPSVEIVETPDYTARISNDQSKYKFWGTEYALTKPDPYPIKTYVDYGLDRDPKEEFKIDPLSAVLEYMGGMKPEEEMWLQILIRVHKKEKHKPGTWFEKADWTAEAKREIEKIVKEGAFKTEENKNPTFITLSKGQQDVVAALERNISKLPFDVGIRSMYITTGKFNIINVFSMIGLLRPFHSNTLNGFKLQNPTGTRGYPWEDFRNIRTTRMRKRMFDAYIRRSYFHPPYHRKPFVLSNEELATIYHFPGQAVSTPSFGRIESRKAEPPTNLPVG